MPGYMNYYSISKNVYLFYEISSVYEDVRAALCVVGVIEDGGRFIVSQHTQDLCTSKAFNGHCCDDHKKVCQIIMCSASREVHGENT